MKILYLIHEFYPAHHGGSEKFILQLAQRAQAQGHQVKIVTYDKNNHYKTPSKATDAPLRSQLKKLAAIVQLYAGLQTIWHKYIAPKIEAIQSYEEIYEGVPVLGFRATWADRNHFQFSDPNLTGFAEELLQREAPDVIHAGYLLRNAELIYAAQRLQIPYLITLTSFWLICPRHTLINETGATCAGPRNGKECKLACPAYSDRQIAARQTDMQRLLDQAGAIVAPSNYMARIFQREVKGLQITYIPYGIDCQKLSFNKRSYPSEQPLVFLFGGRLVPEKGISLLLTAFKRLPSRRVRLHIYGDGPLRADIEQAAQIDPRIYYGGVYTQDQVGALLNQIDVVVVPSVWHENLPLIMQEAQASGVPTLVSDVGGMTECVTDGLNGFTFRVGDVADLQQKMQMMIDQPEILNKIKEDIANPKPGQYQVTSLAKEAQLYIEQYTQILATHNKIA
ncbi:MAG: glycosyltransferase family 4 protein [Caldilineaceae bacterium]